MEQQDFYDDTASDLDFTHWARESFFNAVDDPYFRGNDAIIIYNTLKDEMKVASFGDYLKRYIYRKAEMKEPYATVPTNWYQQIIVDEFTDRSVPCSFRKTTAKLSAVAKNWLNQQSVDRDVVLLLGFGLGMSMEDVNDFLTKALLETRLDPKSPHEVICWYCYKHQYGFYKYSQLWALYQTLQGVPVEESVILDSTIKLRNDIFHIRTDQDLLRYLSKLRATDGVSRQSVMAKRAFDSLYTKAREMIAEIYNAEEHEDSSVQAERLAERMSRDDRYYDYQKQEMIRRKRDNRRYYSSEEITGADLEQVILSAVPKGLHGNLVPMKSSTLNQQFRSRRMSRKRISDILLGKVAISRYDLITLNFFIYSQRLDDFRTVHQRYSAFIEDTNRLLADSSMASLYITNPYECFLLMCMLSDDPLGTYADVWELSYDEMRSEP